MMRQPLIRWYVYAINLDCIHGFGYKLVQSSSIDGLIMGVLGNKKHRVWIREKYSNDKDSATWLVNRKRMSSQSVSALPNTNV